MFVDTRGGGERTSVQQSRGPPRADILTEITGTKGASRARVLTSMLHARVQCQRDPNIIRAVLSFTAGSFQERKMEQ